MPQRHTHGLAAPLHWCLVHCGTAVGARRQPGRPPRVYMLSWLPALMMMSFRDTHFVHRALLTTWRGEGVGEKAVGTRGPAWGPCSQQHHGAHACSSLATPSRGPGSTRPPVVHAAGTSSQQQGPVHVQEWLLGGTHPTFLALFLLCGL